MTQREFLTKVIATTNEAEVREYAEKQLVKLDERNAKRSSTLNKDQKENLVHKEHIVDFLKGREGYTVASVIGENCNISLQKASALCRQLREGGLVSASEVKQEGKKGKVLGYMLIEPNDSEE